MPWYRNKSTGMKWHVLESGLVKRLARSPDYEEIPDPREEVAEEHEGESTLGGADLPTMPTLAELRKRARSAGIKGYARMKKDEIAKALHDEPR